MLPFVDNCHAQNSTSCYCGLAWLEHLSPRFRQAAYVFARYSIKGDMNNHTTDKVEICTDQVDPERAIRIDSPIKKESISVNADKAEMLGRHWNRFGILDLQLIVYHHGIYQKTC